MTICVVIGVYPRFFNKDMSSLQWPCLISVRSSLCNCAQLLLIPTDSETQKERTPGRKKYIEALSPRLRSKVIKVKPMERNPLYPKAAAPSQWQLIGHNTLYLLKRWIIAGLATSVGISILVHVHICIYTTYIY